MIASAGINESERDPSGDPFLEAVGLTRRGDGERYNIFKRDSD